MHEVVHGDLLGVRDVAELGRQVVVVLEAGVGDDVAVRLLTDLK